MAGQAAGAAPGVVGFAGVGLDIKSGGSPISAAMATYLIFLAAVAYLVIIYFGLGGFRGAVAS